jgi:hypothetical protein
MEEQPQRDELSCNNDDIPRSLEQPMRPMSGLDNRNTNTIGR